MELIEFFYGQKIQKSGIFPRKRPLDHHSRLCLVGPKYCGKRSLLRYEALDRFEPSQILFIDCEDLRCEQNLIQKSLQNFIDEQNIRLLVLNVESDFTLPRCENIWISSTRPFLGFHVQRMRNLDFEEFLAFERRSDPKVALNLFLRGGNFPEIVQLPEAKKERRSQEILRLSFKDDLPILKEIAYFQGHPASAHFIFKRLKEHTKISKDRFYTLFERWQEEGYIHPVPKWNAKRAAKKLFFYNFLVKPLLHTHREFPKIFENMVFLEIDEECYYLDPLGFYLPQSRKIVVAIPFGNEVRIQNKIDQLLSKNRLELERIEVVTIGSSFRYEIEGIECEIVPFYEWALGE